MALDKSTLKNSLKSIMESQGNTPESVAEALANAIDTYVRGAEVTITALPNEVSVEGSPSAQANAVSLTLKGGDATHDGGLS
jgi:predicted RNase H-like HicB family nuclease